MQQVAAKILPEDASWEERRAVDTGTVADLVARFPGCTSRELAVFSGLDRFQIARRLPDAARIKRTPQRVWRGRPRACEVTGRMAITWWPRPVPTALPDGISMLAAP